MMQWQHDGCWIWLHCCPGIAEDVRQRGCVSACFHSTTQLLVKQWRPALDVLLDEWNLVCRCPYKEGCQLQQQGRRERVARAGRTRST